MAKFPIEKILTCDAGNWFITERKNPWEYKLVGLHLSKKFEQDRHYLEEFAKIVPETAEVVTSFRYNVDSHERWLAEWHVSAVAIVPRREDAK